MCAGTDSESFSILFFSFINLHLLPVICFGNRVQGVNKWTNRHFNLLLSLEKREREIKCCALWRWSHSIFFSSSFLCSETCSFRSIDASTIIIIVAQVVIDVGVLSIYRATEKKKKKHFKKLLHTCNFLLSFDLRQLIQTRSISRPWIWFFFFSLSPIHFGEISNFIELNENCLWRAL